MAVKKTEEVIEIKPIEMRTITVKVVGDTPLIMHAWSQKAINILKDPQLAKLMKKKQRTPIDDFIQSMYWLEGKPNYDPMDPPNDKIIQDMFDAAIENGAKFGFPVTAFKQSAISAAYRMGWAKDKMSLRGAFFISGYSDDMVEIVSDIPIIRQDMVKVGMGSADVRFRGEFRNWTAELKIKYNVNGKYSLDDIVNIINAGGMVCGVGEWRPERDGQFGTYHVESAE